MEHEKEVDTTLNNIIVQHLIEEQRKNKEFKRLSPLKKAISNTEALLGKYRKQIKRQHKVLEKTGLDDLRTVPIVSMMAELYELVKDLEFQLQLLKDLEVRK